LNAIPFTVERRPDTGVNNVQLGVWLFLASEAMLFAGLFSAYFTLRAGAIAPWTPFRNHLALASVNTVVLMIAGAALAFSARAARARDNRRFRSWLLVSCSFAMAFCAFKGSEYAEFIGAHLRPSTSTHLAMYFLLTGVHLLHVLGGVLVNAWIALTPKAAWSRAPEAVVNRLEAAALYWYFVDAIWLIIFVVLYVV
jgi:cytochrome c oxidase subunit III